MKAAIAIGVCAAFSAAPLACSSSTSGGLSHMSADAGSTGGASGASGASGGGGASGASGGSGAGGTSAGGATSDAGGATGGTSASGGSPGTGGGTADGGGDVFGPFAGGAQYYAKFSHGPPSDPSFFPITVWLQSPDRAADYAAIGINTYVGLWQGPTDAQISTLAATGMPVACDQNATGLAHLNDATIVAWTQQDEPDNAQPATGGGYDPCIPASTIKSLYAQMKASDPTRPVFLNLGQGVAHDYIGWGSECAATHPADYPDYVAGADIVSFDIYPSNETSTDVAGKLWYVAEGVKNLVRWAGKKPVWNWIECTGIDDPSLKPTPDEVKAEVWMSIVNGSMGIGYFVHQFQPSFDEHALLDDATMKAAVAAINAQLRELAPVLNTPPVTNGGSVSSSDSSVPVDMLIKRQGGATYVFAVAMRGSPTHAAFSGLTRIPAGATVTVLGESRDITLGNDGFEDDFPAWGVHLYEIH